MWCVTAREAKWRFLQPGVRRRRPRRMSVCDAAFCNSAGWGAARVHPYRCGLVSGAGGRRAREILQKDNLIAAMACTSSVAALRADDFTVRRGATRPVAPCRARAIAAHFMIAARSQLRQRGRSLTRRIRDLTGERRCAPVSLSEASAAAPRPASGSLGRLLIFFEVPPPFHGLKTPPLKISRPTGERYSSTQQPRSALATHRGLARRPAPTTH